ncbi:MAG: hypothetical protein QXW94_05785 [Desulfurococcaceae archaeon]
MMVEALLVESPLIRKPVSFCSLGRPSTYDLGVVSGVYDPLSGSGFLKCPETALALSPLKKKLWSASSLAPSTSYILA